LGFSRAEEVVKFDSCSDSAGCTVTRVYDNFPGGSVTISIRGDFEGNDEYADIYINGNKVARCDGGGTDCESTWYTCGTYQHNQQGQLIIEARTSSAVNWCSPYAEMKSELMLSDAPAQVSGTKLEATFNFGSQYADPDSAQFQGLMRSMESEVLTYLKAESGASILGVQIDASKEGRRRLDNEVTLDVFVQTENPEDAESLVQTADALPPGSITNSVNAGIANAGVEGVGMTGHTKPEVSIKFSTPNVDSASSHGDPIIHTFKGECYDLNKDGIYLASSHPRWNHDIKVAVYNNFIREFQITTKDDQILFSISNFNEVTGRWIYGLKHLNRMCTPPFSFKECEFSFHEYRFDAQVFMYGVQILFHNYLDPALQKGQRGVHLDIYPRLYDVHKQTFKPEDWDGIYFDNPLPQELAYCPANSPRRS